MFIAIIHKGSNLFNPYLIINVIIIIFVVANPKISGIIFITGISHRLSCKRKNVYTYKSNGRFHIISKQEMVLMTIQMRATNENTTEVMAKEVLFFNNKSMIK